MPIKQITYILTIMLCAACGQNNRNAAKKSTNLQLNTLSETNLDTLMANNYLLTFEDTDSFEKTDIYGDLDYRTKLTDTIENFFNKAQTIQTYLTKQFGDYFYVTDTMLVLKLSDGNTINFDRYVEEKDWDNDGLETYIFEHYFKNIDYYLLMVQYYEGNDWMLVNRKNGFKKKIHGLPYISRDNKKIIVVNSDIDAGYNFNGIELYTVLADSLQTEFHRETKWGPIDVKWIDENEFLLKREYWHNDGNRKSIDYKRVNINK